MRQLRQEAIAIIYISHRMNEVYQLSDRVSVLRNGEYVGTLDRDQISPDTIVRMMVRRESLRFTRRPTRCPKNANPSFFLFEI